MTKQIDSLNSSESGDLSSKLTKQKNNWKDKIKNIITSWIAAGSMWWIAPAPTHTLPVSNKNTITCIEPSSTDIKTIWPRTTAKLFATFKEWSNKIPKIDTPTNNNTEATLDVNQYETDITKWEDWTTAETEANNSTINSLEYKALEIENINPVDILPIIWQVEAGDKNAYNHIEHLRIAEATRIRDMMWKYGAGNYSPEEYQQLMKRLNTGMTLESPKWYDNYEIIWWNVAEPWWTNHAHDERNILNNLVNHANFYVVDPGNANRNEKLYEFVKNNPNSIYIFWNSAYAEVDKWTYESRDNDDIKNLSKSKNFLIFVAGWNIGTKNWILRNKIYHEDVNGDEHWLYSLPSSANWKNDASPDRHLIVSVWTDADWDIDQTNEIYESSKFPEWFHKDVLFAGRTFPRFKLSSWKIVAETWKYPTSYVNYLNVAIADILFQMKADVSDVDELLEMIRSTALTDDHIRFDLNGDWDTNDTHEGQPETQPLHLMNPAWFFKEYLMPTSLPVNLRTNEAIPLKKWYYHGVVYQIPGAEVNIDGQWIPFTDDNKEIIFSQNPMNLEWRLNGESLNNYNYKPGDTINGQIIAVDDQWNGLNITKDFSVNIEDASGINTVTMNYTSDAWYTIDGIRLDSKPTKPGIYIVNGQKVIIK